MDDQRRSLLRRILSVPVEIVVAIYVVVDGIVAPLFGPVMRFLSDLRLIRRIEAAIASLPPYVILVLMVVPFGVAELAKVYAVLLMAEEHFRTGLTIFIGAYVVSILVCERILEAGKEQLMTIGWFKVVYDWVMAIKAHVLGRLKATRAWRLATTLRERARNTIIRMRARLHAMVRPKEKRRLAP